MITGTIRLANLTTLTATLEKPIATQSAPTKVKSTKDLPSFDFAMLSARRHC